MKTVKLNNGAEMPIPGFGVYQLTDPDVCQQAVTDALEVGYRLIDTASAYNNEEAVGSAIRKSRITSRNFRQTGNIPSARCFF